MRAAVLTLALIATACSREEAPSRPPAPPIALTPPTQPPAEAPAPSAPPPPAETAFPSPPEGARIATGPRGGLAAWSASRKAVRVQPLGLDGTPTSAPREVELTSAHKLHAVYPVAGGFAVASHDLCAERKYFFKCLYLRGFSADGAPDAAERFVTTREWIREERVAISGEVTAILTSHMYIPPAVTFLSPGQDGSLAATRRDLEAAGDLLTAVRLTPIEGGFEAVLRAEAEEPGRRIRLRIDRAGAPLGSTGPSRATAPSP